MNTEYKELEEQSEDLSVDVSEEVSSDEAIS